MNCSACVNRNSCGARAASGDPAAVSAAITGEQIVQIACAAARVGSLLCDIGGVGLAQERGHPRVDPAVARLLLLPDDEPYIWDVD